MSIGAEVTTSGYIPSADPGVIPALSNIGLMAMAVLMFAAGAFVPARRRLVAGQ